MWEKGEKGIRKRKATATVKKKTVVVEGVIGIEDSIEKEEKKRMKKRQAEFY